MLSRFRKHWSAKLFPNLREWWSRTTAGMVGVKPGFEQTNAALRNVRDLSGRLGLDSERTIQLLRPRYRVITASGEYGPMNHLLPERLYHALNARQDLPHELHVLATDGEESRKALVKAVHAYAQHIAPSFPVDVLTEHVSDAAPRHAARSLVWKTMEKTCNQLDTYVRTRKIKSPFLLKAMEGFALVKAARKAEEKRRMLESKIPLRKPDVLVLADRTATLPETEKIPDRVEDGASRRRRPKIKSRRPRRRR